MTCPKLPGFLGKTPVFWLNPLLFTLDHAILQKGPMWSMELKMLSHAILRRIAAVSS